MYDPHKTDDNELFLSEEYEYDERGYPIKRTYYEADGRVGTQEYKYNEQGYLISGPGINDIPATEEYPCIEYEYNEQGYLIKMSSSVTSDTMQPFEYDNQGKLIRSSTDIRLLYLTNIADIAGIAKLIKINPEEDVRAVNFVEDCEYRMRQELSYAHSIGLPLYEGREFEYDENGNLIKIYDDSDGMQKPIYEYEYDENGNLKGAVERSGDRLLAEYNAQGMIIKETQYYGNGEPEEWREYEYDGRGNLIRYRCDDAYGDINGDVWDQREYEYDEKGMLTKVIESSNYEEPRITREYEHEYDEQGNPIKVIRYIIRDSSANREPAGWYECEYDKQGNLIKSKVYNNNDGNLWEQAEYEYY